MQIGDLLITEHQLDTRLNKSVHEHRRGEFSLLLAMLSHDALDFSQFHLPKSENINQIADEDALRQQFAVGPQQHLAPPVFDMLIGHNNVDYIKHSGERAGMSDIRLNHYLNPEPLAVRDDTHHISYAVLDNCEVAVRKRIKQSHTELANIPIDAAAFYNDLKNTNLHKPLHVVHA
jgi:hypothetical protein